MKRAVRAASAAGALVTLAACAGGPAPGASSWPPPCAGSRILEVRNPTNQAWEVTWGDERLGTAEPGISRLPVSSIRIIDSQLVGAPIFRVRTNTGLPGPAIVRVQYRLLCE